MVLYSSPIQKEANNIGPLKLWLAKNKDIFLQNALSSVAVIYFYQIITKMLLQTLICQ